MGNFWTWIWTLIFLQVAGFLCFAGEVGSVSSEQECFQPPQNGNSLIENLFPFPQIFVLCIYIMTSDQTPWLQVELKGKA